jgi:hypothetical protein
MRVPFFLGKNGVWSPGFGLHLWGKCSNAGQGGHSHITIEGTGTFPNHAFEHLTQRALLKENRRRHEIERTNSSFGRTADIAGDSDRMQFFEVPRPIE